MWHCYNRFTNITSLHTRTKLSSHTPCKCGSREVSWCFPQAQFGAPPCDPCFFEQFGRRQRLLEGERCRTRVQLLDFSGPIKFVSWIDLLQSPISNCYSSHTSLLAWPVLVSSQQTCILASTAFFPAHLLWPQKCPNSCPLTQNPWFRPTPLLSRGNE